MHWREHDSAQHSIITLFNQYLSLSAHCVTASITTLPTSLHSSWASQSLCFKSFMSLHNGDPTSFPFLFASPLPQLVLTVGLLAVVVYLYTVVAFNFFRKFYNKSEDDDDPDMKCDDMMTVRVPILRGHHVTLPPQER